MRKKFSIYQLTSILFIIGLIFLSGCSSKETMLLINNYAKTSSTTQKNILDTYKDTIYQEQQSLYYKAVRDGSTVKQLTPKTIEYKGQKKALKDLVEFTEALTKISSDYADEEIDENTLKLYNSASKLSKNEYVASNADISDKDIELFTTILNTGTKGYIEYKKTKTLKELILISDKWVKITLSGLDKDLEAWKRHLKKSLNSRKNIQLLILNDPYKYCKIKNKDRECHVLSDSFKSKVELYKEVHNIQKRINNLDKEFATLKKSLSLLSKLHKEIIESIKQDKLDDISKATLKRNFYKLKEMSESVKNFRRSTEG